MSAYDVCRAIEQKGFERLRPFLSEAGKGYVLNSKSRLATYLQKPHGDGILEVDFGCTLTVEIKVEEATKRNLFLETLSNMNLRDKGNHFSHGMEPGWMYTSRADLLLYLFLQSDRLFILDFFKLKKWFFGYQLSKNHRNYERFPEVPQTKYSQINDTYGRLVALKDIHAEVGYISAYTQQPDFLKPRLSEEPIIREAIE
jgi:hypothetical protein